MPPYRLDSLSVTGLPSLSFSLSHIKIIELCKTHSKQKRKKNKSKQKKKKANLNKNKVSKCVNESLKVEREKKIRAEQKNSI